MVLYYGRAPTPHYLVIVAFEENATTTLGIEEDVKDDARRRTLHMQTIDQSRANACFWMMT